MTPKYTYRVISASSADALSQHINKATENEWELVPGQSVTVATYPLVNRDTGWSYTVIMRTLA